MSLYYEAAAILQNTENVGGSLKSRIYGRKDLKSPPATIFALVSEASKWSVVLKDVVERSGILGIEKKLTPTLSLLLTHDLLLSKRGVACPASHPLKLAITRHKARLSAELTKYRIRAKFPTLDALRVHVNATTNGGKEPAHPRWIRVNTLRTTLAHQLETTFANYTQSDSLAAVMAASPTAKILHLDAHIPNLLALPPRADFSKTKAYAAGEIIFQDKASCFPAVLLDATAATLGDEDELEGGGMGRGAGPKIIDACAAPGNKTTHLAAIFCASVDPSTPFTTPPILACERDTRRAAILDKMVTLARADHRVTTRPGQDFLRLDPKKAGMSEVRALLLDPSCSGSGIVGRDEGVGLRFVLPEIGVRGAAVNEKGGKSKKRKRKGTEVEKEATDGGKGKVEEVEVKENEVEVDGDADADALKTRLENLSGFQLKLLCHAMAFPNARRVTYSTCSIHAEENENVVVRALNSNVARKQGWRVLRRDEQVEGMRKWNVRGTKEACVVEGVEMGEEEKGVVADACIRCEKGTMEGTMGFFVAGFVRDGNGEGNMESDDVDQRILHHGEDDDEWNGFSDDG
ncbi:S-adenosyl-L-methionine-dependent methyltransferase [Saccharata proteae CBS 121410]|uniref:S-adenosyl-L-methionine-dependent methyltransferase n=1 Tax=Saccharata proteae CBS 121410 TaxID=1314787 RepID=A0A9P4LVV5_9PEZI|nr:S-adenosyl-L-methionine-dependent methyltransferase [Saccharata proteae CBS 121410]